MQESEDDGGRVHEDVVLVPQRQLGQPEAQDGHEKEEGVAVGQAAEQVGEGAAERLAEEDNDAQAVADQPEGGDGCQNQTLDVKPKVGGTVAVAAVTAVAIVVGAADVGQVERCGVVDHAG